MIYSRFVLVVAFALSFSDFVAAQSGTPISQSDMPWASPGPGTYFLAEDVRQSSGLALDVRHNDVTILLSGHTVEWGVSSDGMMMDTNGHNNVTLRGPGRFVQGGASPSATSVVNGRIDGTNITIDGGIQFILKATPGVTGSRGFLVGSGNNSSVIRDCTFDVSGNGVFFLLYNAQNYKFLNNSVNVHNWTHSNKDYYCRVFNECGGAEFGYNVVDIGDVSATNVFYAWGDDNYHIHHNTVRFAAFHGRIVTADQGCENWLVEHNRVIVTSVIDGTVYAFMVRVPNGGTTAPSRGHVFRYNEVDTTGASGPTIGFSFGSKNTKTDVVLQNNIFRGKNKLLSFGGGITNNIDISCNQFIHVRDDGGSALFVRGGSSTDVDLSNNLWQTQRPDGVIMIIQESPSLDWTLCDNEGLSDSSVMTTSVGGVHFTSESACGNIGASDCWKNAGADVEPAPPPPTATKPLPPSNITIE